LPWKNATEGFDSAKATDPGTTANNAWMNMSVSGANQQICQFGNEATRVLDGNRQHKNVTCVSFVRVRPAIVSEPAGPPGHHVTKPYAPLFPQISG
jgi:hypothetical protein